MCFVSFNRKLLFTPLPIPIPKPTRKRLTNGLLPILKMFPLSFKYAETMLKPVLTDWRTDWPIGKNAFEAGNCLWFLSLTCRGSANDNLRVMGQTWPFACCVSGKERITKKFGKTNVSKGCSKKLNSTNKPAKHIQRYEVNLNRFNSLTCMCERKCRMTRNSLNEKTAGTNLTLCSVCASP